MFNGFQGCQQSHLIICGELHALRITAWLPPLPLPPFAEQEFEKAKENQFIGRDWAQGLGSRIKAAIPYTQMQSNMSNAINFIKVHQNSHFIGAKYGKKNYRERLGAMSSSCSPFIIVQLIFPSFHGKCSGFQAERRERQLGRHAVATLHAPNWERNGTSPGPNNSIISSSEMIRDANS